MTRDLGDKKIDSLSFFYIYIDENNSYKDSNRLSALRLLIEEKAIRIFRPHYNTLDYTFTLTNAIYKKFIEKEMYSISNSVFSYYDNLDLAQIYFEYLNQIKIKRIVAN